MKLRFTSLLMLLFVTGYAQEFTDTTGKRSPARTLTSAQYQAYLKGEAGEDWRAWPK
ncbi:hypothetical protein HK413_04705 [Mucilaginibacter sp. S1162]|uniref:Uncharacterized protein n=1 Tax=Mucilaginibacter humi TaxID=2732510 RepID=A0ABX1W079_9SPHI|nr:hypothetical protein [Mucilaginibacter humi]NNU33624.1 hypothetical protein [Mucilaginibacter humi]